ncbi:hypothetical protein Taro_009893 [Colocasia esculenta]|uniref:Uncharacterized protein n=1 Tax=Colocasia esculenta TaxID=4460 RepID=A0A843U256_COLES|nr:hypothetical protein [Colocasia esculenta]
MFTMVMTIKGEWNRDLSDKAPMSALGLRLVSLFAEHFKGIWWMLACCFRPHTLSLFSFTKGDYVLRNPHLGSAFLP